MAKAPMKPAPEGACRRGEGHTAGAGDPRLGGGGPPAVDARRASRARRSAAAGQRGPAARGGRLAGAGELPPRARQSGRRAPARACAAQLRVRPGRQGAGGRLRLCRAPARDPVAAARHLGAHQPEKLHGPSRCLYPRHRRRRDRLRPHPRGVRRQPLARDLSSVVPDRGAPGLAPVADALLPRQGRGHRRDAERAAPSRAAYLQ